MSLTRARLYAEWLQAAGGGRRRPALFPPDDVLRVLAHRADVVSSQYLKTALGLPKGLSYLDEKRVLVSALLGGSRASAGGAKR